MDARPRSGRGWVSWALRPGNAEWILSEAIMSTPFAALANLCEKLEGTTKRLELADSVAQFLLKLAPEEVPAGVRLIIGQVFPEWDGRALDLSWKAVARVVEGLTKATPAQREAIFAQAVDGGQAVQLLLEKARIGPPQGPPLSLLDVYRAFEEIAAAAGRGSRARKEALLRRLLLRATPLEAKYIVKNVLAEMRHGVGEGIMLEAIARAAGVKTALVRRANQLWGDLGEVAAVALAEGEAGLKRASSGPSSPCWPRRPRTWPRPSSATGAGWPWSTNWTGRGFRFTSAATRSGSTPASSPTSLGACQRWPRRSGGG